MSNTKKKRTAPRLHSLRLHELDTQAGKMTAEETIASDDSGAVTMRVDFSDLAELLAQLERDGNPRR
jgi:hypothetical protein